MSYELNDVFTDSYFKGKNFVKDSNLASNYRFTVSDTIIYSTLFELAIFLNPIKYIYYRKYMKFEDVIINVSSYLSILLLFFNLVGSYYNKTIQKHDFIKDYFKEKIDGDGEEIKISRESIKTRGKVTLIQKKLFKIKTLLRKKAPLF